MPETDDTEAYDPSVYVEETMTMAEPEPKKSLI